MKLSSTLPDSPDNGLAGILHALRYSPEDQHVVIAVVDTCKLTTNVDTGAVDPTIRIVAIEPMVDDADATTAQLLMAEAARVRTGQETLDFDPATGEIKAAS